MTIEKKSVFIYLAGKADDAKKAVSTDEYYNVNTILTKKVFDAFSVRCHSFHYSEDISILDLAKLVKSVVGFNGDIISDIMKPDGTPRKLMDVSKLTDLGWKARISLEEGIKKVYDEVKDQDWLSEVN